MTVLSFQSALELKEASRLAEVRQALTLLLDVPVPVDPTGQLEPAFAARWQQKMTALGLDIDVARLSFDQFAPLNRATSAWGFLALRRMDEPAQGVPQSETEAYLQAVAAGAPGTVQLPQPLRDAVTQATTNKDEGAVPRRAHLQLVKSA